jgi:surface antigen
VIKLTNSPLLVALATTTLLVAGCGGSGSDGAASSSAGAPASSGAPKMSDEQAPPDRLVVQVTIKGGQVTPTNAQLQSSVGEPIVVQVNSDAADQLHVHSNPEHTFNVEPKSGQSFQFTVDVPGKVDVELHELNRTIATIQVQ